MSFTDEAGVFAAEFFRNALSNVETWSQSRDLALEFLQATGAEAVKVARGREASTVARRDIEEAIERVVPQLRCPLSPKAEEPEERELSAAGSVARTR